MTKIYGSASLVIAWLGQEDKDRKAAFQVYTRLAEAVRHEPSGGPGTSLTWSDSRIVRQVQKMKGKLAKCCMESC